MIVITNMTNDESYYENNSSVFDSELRKQNGNYLNFQSNEYYNLYDFKLKNDFDNDEKYANFTKDPK